MKQIQCEQGSPEWLYARLGIPTASNFDEIITPKTMKPSGSQGKYLATLCAEWWLGEPVNDYQSPFMERGSDMEASAVAFWEFETGLEASKCGLCLRDDGKVGASPDRLVGTDGALEIKCPSAEVHMAYLIAQESGHNGGTIGEYWCQLQGELWIAERAWVDLLCFHPVFPRILVRVERDEEFIAALAKEVDTFVIKLDEAKARLEPLRPVPTVRRERAYEPDPFATADV